jgi:hypothetical protein
MSARRPGAQDAGSESVRHGRHGCEAALGFPVAGLPQLDEAWARDFSRGLFALAEQYGVELAGGDTTRGR